MSSRWSLAALWLVLTTACAATALYWRWSAAVTLFERDVATLHRAVSQRVDQHDAHLTALSALVASGGSQSANIPLMAVSASIAQFYPRVVAIDVVRLQPEASVLWSQRQGTGEASLELIARSAERNVARSGLVSSPKLTGRYLLVKRVPSDERIRYVISLEIDGRLLVGADGADFNRVALLGMNDDTPIHKSTGHPPEQKFGMATLTARKSVASVSQPLMVVAERDMSLVSIFPWLAATLSAIAAGGILYLLRAIAAHRAAVKDAIRKADASARDARLAHATKINSMGELSLAIAHELAQPLAALLSQSQAGLRMLKSGTTDQAAIAGILEANARLAKRAGDILSTLRGWVSEVSPPLQPVDLNGVIAAIGSFNQTDLARRGLELKLELSDTAPITLADPVGIEQIVQNLLANARDASPAHAVISIATFATDGRVGFTVTDGGPGFAAEIVDRAFEPFVTSKTDGMGLGLSISRRLVDKFGGKIEASKRVDGQTGTAMTVDLPAHRRGTLD